MSDKKSILMLCTIVALAGFLATSSGLFTNSPTQTGSYAMMGHVTTLVTDSDGNIKAYQQGDNDIVDEGVDCASDAIFDPDPFSSACTTVDTVGIHSNTFEVVDSFTLIPGTISTGAASLTDTENASTGGGSASLTLFRTFNIGKTDTVGSTSLISGNGELFAGQELANAIPVLPGDEVTINWELTVGGI